ncbi:hypothetical protein [Nibricoccus sp. IMCC34717]|uniref:hypothetical protein n=1 Tax=Nibricoccus sp. IMCC34717 TaxID=3034021 RepID=UPI00384E3278
METLDEVRGDSWTYQIGEISADDGTAVTDISLWHAECVLRDRPNGSVIFTKSTAAASIQRVAGPAFEVKFTAAETGTVAPGTYYLAATIISPSGTRRTNHRFNLRIAA